MKKLLIAMFLTAFAMSVSAQKLIDLYKKGTILLVPDVEYASKNSWDKVFSTYYDTIYGTPMGNRKSLIIMPDGSVVINHAYRDYYTKFSPNGKFEKEFGITNNKGSQFKKISNIAGIVNNNTFFTGLNNMGNMICFDFNGSYVKTLKLDYMTKQMISLPNHKIAVVGWVIWKTKFRDFVAIVDYETNAQKIIWEQYTNRCEEADPKTGQEQKGLVHCKIFNYGYMFKEQGGFSFNSMPFSNGIGLSAPPQIACTGNKLIVSIPATGEILAYDLDGTLKSKEKIGWAANVLSVKEQQEIQQKAIDKYKSNTNLIFAKWVSPEENKLAQEAILREMESDMNKITEPIPIPTFSNIIKDSDGNLLFFEYPKEENANKFNVWVFENKGTFICKSSFVCDDYTLEINPSKMVFHNGYIYGLQLLKKAQGVPLRLVRFKLTNK